MLVDFDNLAKIFFLIIYLADQALLASNPSPRGPLWSGTLQPTVNRPSGTVVGGAVGLVVTGRGFLVVGAGVGGIVGTGALGSSGRVDKWSFFVVQTMSSLVVSLQLPG